MNNTELSIDAELQAWIEPLTAEELAGLEASLLADGCRDPLVVWSGWLLDGHNRYALCRQHGIAFQTVEKTGLATKADVKIWMIENQLGKRNMSDFGRVALALKLKPLIEARARARQATSTGGDTPQLRQNSDEAGGRTDDAVAKMANVSRDTVRKVEQIIARATSEVVANVRSGEMSISAAAKTVAPPRPAREPAAPAPEPAGPRLSVQQGAAAVLELDALVAENAELREELDELKASFADTLADNEAMGKVIDADDQLKAAMDENLRLRAVAESAERMLRAKSGEFAEAIRTAKYWKNRAEKAEKMNQAAA